MLNRRVSLTQHSTIQVVCGDQLQLSHIRLYSAFLLVIDGKSMQQFWVLIHSIVATMYASPNNFDITQALKDVAVAEREYHKANPPLRFMDLMMMQKCGILLGNESFHN